MAALVNLQLCAALLLLLSITTAMVRAESAMSKACRAELVNLASQSTLCPTCTTYFWILNQTLPMMAGSDLAYMKRTFILIPTDEAYKPYEKFLNPVNVSFALNTAPLFSYHGSYTSVSQLYKAAPARYKTEKIKPLLVIEKTAFSTKGTYKDIVYFSTRWGAKEAKVLRLIKSYPKCITAFQTNKVLIPANYKV